MIKARVTEHGDHQTLTIELPPTVRLEGTEVLFDSESNGGKLVLTGDALHARHQYCQRHCPGSFACCTCEA